LALLPLTLLEPLVEPNLRHFPSSRKKAMTGLKAAEEEEAERRRQRRAAAVAKQGENARDEHEERGRENCYDRRALSPKPTCFSRRELLPILPIAIIAVLLLDDSSEDSDSDNFLNQDGGIRQSGRVRRPTRAVQSQMSQDAAAQREREQMRQRKGKGKGRQKRKEKTKNTSQLMEDYCIDSE
jgi:hypothetical protein